ncbi:MAG: triose-phosphate isomerase [Candidatus Pacearchaeota archaeon]|nr:triose-phosphate isomerase [Candidatus Pacearchaeota archaeon]
MKPLIVINLKTYQQGQSSVKIAKEIEKVSKDIVVGVQASDVYEIAKKTKLKVYAQHVDPYEPGRNTGYILPEAVKKDGAVGTFLNHSEHKLSQNVLKKTIARCKKVKLKTMVFVKDIRQAKQIEKLKPDYLIYEPPELVAGNISVSTSKPEIIKKISNNIKMKFLVGAGIKTKEDIELSMKLGAAGVAFSSVITKAREPGKKLKELIE